MIEIREAELVDLILTELEGNPIVTQSEKVWVGNIDGCLIAIWGVIPQSLLSGRVHLWSWAAPAMRSYRKTFVKLSKQVVNDLLDEYTLLGICSGDHHWLSWLGAEFGEDIQGYPSFEIKRHG